MAHKGTVIIRALRASRLWKRLFPTPPAPQPQISIQIHVPEEDHGRFRDHLATLKLEAAGQAFASAVISALEEKAHEH